MIRDTLRNSAADSIGGMGGGVMGDWGWGFGVGLGGGGVGMGDWGVGAWGINEHGG